MIIVKNFKNISKKELEDLVESYLSNKKNIRRSIFEKMMKDRMDLVEELFENVSDNLLNYILNSNQTMSLEDRKKYLYDKELHKKLYRYARVILTEDTKVIALRGKIGLQSPDDVIHHILHFSETGSNHGCGCKLCTLRNSNYYVSKRVKSIENQLYLLGHIEKVIEKAKDTKSPLIDPFENELFNKANKVLCKNKQKSKGKIRVVTLNSKNGYSVIDERVNNSSAFLLKELEKWALKQRTNEDIIHKFRLKTLLP